MYMRACICLSFDTMNTPQVTPGVRETERVPWTNGSIINDMCLCYYIQDCMQPPFFGFPCTANNRSCFNLGVVISLS